MRDVGIRSIVVRVLGPALLGALLLAAAPGSALAGWGPPESVDTNINQVQLAPGGPGWVTGFATGSPARLRFMLRPLDGPLDGVPREFPSGLGAGSVAVLGFTPAGDGVGVEQADGQVFGFTASAGLMGTLQQLPAGFYPRLVSVAPTGEAIVGMNGNGPFSPVRLAFRPAGLNAQVNTVDTVDLSNAGVLIGLQLQDDGGAIAVWQEGDVLRQAVRPSGSVDFNTPTTIASPSANLSVASFSSDPSGWAMLSWVASSTGAGARDQVIATVRAPDGSFPAGTVVGSGQSVVNATPAVTSSGDGLVAWRQDGLGSPSCPASAIRGALQHRGAWAAAQDIGPAAWPDTSVQAYAGNAWSSGNDVAVTLVTVHRDGSPCPTSAVQTRGLVVRHFRSGASGLTDQGTSELVAPAAGIFPTLSGFAMEPGGKALAWYSDGAAGRFLRSFDGVTPGGPGGGGEPPPAATPISAPLPGPSKPAGIAPLRLQQFVFIKPIDPKALALEMECPGDETCNARAWAYYKFTGKQAFGRDKAGVRVSAKKKPKLTEVATGALTLKPGAKGKLKLKPNKTGKALIRSGKKLKITLKVTLKAGTRSATGSFPAQIRAAKKKR